MRRQLTVLSVAFPFAEVSPDATGGAEQVLAALDAALARGGHRSIVLARAGSRVRGTLIAAPSFRTGDWAGAHREYARLIPLLADQYRADVIHCHGLDLAGYLPDAGLPLLGTLHLPISSYPSSLLNAQRPRTYFNCVSEHQRRSCPPGSRVVATIANGVTLPPRHARARRAHVVALGRICEEKGFHLALDAARAAGVPLRLAGRVFGYGEHVRYFRQQILPRLDDGRRFVGQIGPGERRNLLAGARCLLVTSTVPETSSLVAMEALAHGTPVVASRVGALPDIVEDGRTGYLVDDPRDLPRAIAASAALSAAACRESAERRFSVERMTGLYVDLLSRVANDRVEDGRAEDRAVEDGHLRGRRVEGHAVEDGRIEEEAHR